MALGDELVLRWARMDQGDIDVAIPGQFQRLAGADRNHLDPDLVLASNSGSRYRAGLSFRCWWWWTGGWRSCACARRERGQRSDAASASVRGQAAYGRCIGCSSLWRNTAQRYSQIARRAASGAARRATRSGRGHGRPSPRYCRRPSGSESRRSPVHAPRRPGWRSARPAAAGSAASTLARARAMRCFSPPDRRVGSLSRRCVTPAHAIASSTRCAARLRTPRATRP